MATSYWPKTSMLQTPSLEVLDQFHLHNPELDKIVMAYQEMLHKTATLMQRPFVQR